VVEQVALELRVLDRFEKSSTYRLCLKKMLVLDISSGMEAKVLQISQTPHVVYYEEDSLSSPLKMQ
jgi:hypothetical protein